MHSSSSRRSHGRPSRAVRRAVAAVAATTAVSIVGGIGSAFALEPSVARTSSGCSFASSTDRTNNIQTCKVWSDSMQTYVTVKVRASDQQAGQQEQAVYFLGGINDPSGSSGTSLYSTQYNLVMITGSTSTWSSNWQSVPLDAEGNPLTTSSGGTYDPQWETFIGEELPVYLNQGFSIDQTGNAIAGLSISGGQAVNLALKYPELFKVALSTSGYYQTNNPFGWLLIPFILSSRKGISNGLDAMWGSPFADGNSWAANDVASRIWQAKANGQTIIVSTGNGVIGSQAEWDELMALGGVGEAIFGSLLEFVSFVSAAALNVEAAVLGLPVHFIYTTGAHTWTRWERTDEEEAQQVQDALKNYEVPMKSGTNTAVAGSREAVVGPNNADAAPVAIADELESMASDHDNSSETITDSDTQIPRETAEPLISQPGPSDVTEHATKEPTATSPGPDQTDTAIIEEPDVGAGDETRSDQSTEGADDPQSDSPASSPTDELDSSVETAP